MTDLNGKEITCCNECCYFKYNGIGATLHECKLSTLHILADHQYKEIHTLCPFLNT